MMSAVMSRIEKRMSAGAVRTLPSGEIAISKTQRNVHVFFEALAIPAAGVMAYMAYSSKFMPEWQKTFLYVVAGTTLIVDGGLLISYMREKR